MRLLTALLLVLLLRSAEPRRGARSGANNNKGRGRSRSRGGALAGGGGGGGADPGGGAVRGRGRAAAVRRQAGDCKEYVEAGEKYLDCQGKQLTGVMQDWPTDIHHLLLARNNIQVLRDNMFSRFSELRSLDLQQNHISLVEERAFWGLGQLTTLLLQHNALRSASEELLLPLTRLVYLRVYDNPWSCDCGLDSLVRTLQVPSNRNLANYAKCAEPEELRGHKLKKLNVDALCDSPGGNQLEGGPGGGGGGGGGGVDGGGGGGGGQGGKRPKPPPKRAKADATSLCHTYIFPRPLLDCSSKDLKNIPSDLPSDIVKMDLSSNSITQLRPRHFLYAKDLKLLNLSSNSLDRIDNAAFAGLLYLRELDLSNNSLQYFQYGVLEDLYFLRRLSLANNPWICDYNIHYLIYWLKHHPGVSYSGLVCSDPQEFRGWAVEDYVKTYNGECPKDRSDAGQGPGQGQGGGAADREAQEVAGGETDDERLPTPLKDRRPQQFEIIRLS